ncbi:unnamed protein product, partial [Meganyctiphanes norvegica]
MLWLYPFERGFFCDDESIHYPYKESTVTNGILLVVSITVPILTVCGMEWWKIYNNKVIQKLKIWGYKIHPLIWTIVHKLGPFWFGFFANIMFTYIIKYTIGRLRPHFIAVCDPDWSQIQCTTSELHQTYVDPIPCTAEDKYRIKEARMSFPSGHSSVSAFAMVYVVMYLQMQHKLFYHRLLRSVFQILCLSFTVYTSVSRIHDYRHHWSDSLGGFLLGTIVAILTFYYASDLLPDKDILISYHAQSRVIPLQEYQPNPDEKNKNSIHPDQS